VVYSLLDDLGRALRRRRTAGQAVAGLGPALAAGDAAGRHPAAPGVSRAAESGDGRHGLAREIDGRAATGVTGAIPGPRERALTGGSDPVGD
jgi:hypothetical protein